MMSTSLSSQPAGPVEIGPRPFTEALGRGSSSAATKGLASARYLPTGGRQKVGVSGSLGEGATGECGSVSAWHVIGRSAAPLIRPLIAMIGDVIVVVLQD